MLVIINLLILCIVLLVYIHLYNHIKTSNYLEIYEKYFAKYRDNLENFLEIGLWKGDSIRMWRDYFTSGNLGVKSVILFSFVCVMGTFYPVPVGSIVPIKCTIIFHII